MRTNEIVGCICKALIRFGFFCACETRKALSKIAHRLGDYIFQPREKVVYAALIRFKAMSVTNRKLRRKKAARQNKILDNSSLMLLANGAIHSKPTAKSPSKTVHIDI